MPLQIRKDGPVVKQSTRSAAELLPGQAYAIGRIMSVGWIELTVEVPPDWSEPVANFLIENGAPGLQFQEQRDSTLLVAHFSQTAPVEALRRFCSQLTPERTSSRVDIRTRAVADEDWAENWKRYFQAQAVGEHLYICPPWAVGEPSPGRLRITMEPGMAFGTGQHASTRGCLELLERAIAGQRITRALDVGTGSGVLAIALAKLGVPEVWAVDTDPVACSVAQKNAALNGVAESIQVRPALADAPGTFDLVTANLYAAVLQELAPELTRRLSDGSDQHVGKNVCSGLPASDPTGSGPSNRRQAQPRRWRRAGILICAGFLVTDETGIRNAYGADCNVLERWEHESWVSVMFERRAEA